MIKPH